MFYPLSSYPPNSPRSFNNPFPDSPFAHYSLSAVHFSTTAPFSDQCFPGATQGTKDVRLDPQLNKKVWESGIKGVPYRLRVRISRKRNDEEGAKEKLYSYVQAVNVPSAKGLATAVVED